MRNLFQKAERFVQLRTVFQPKTWGDIILRINEMIVNPLITLFLLFAGYGDLFSAIGMWVSTIRIWRERLEYEQLRDDMMFMYLLTMRMGGPSIVTNDTRYMPYVFAHTLTSAEQHHSKTAGIHLHRDT
jgi:hypothetical protein